MSDLIGIHLGVPADTYHASDGISSSGLRRMLPPYTPAHYRYGEFEPTAALDFGRVAHRLVLGAGDEFAVGDFGDWRTKAAREFADEARKAGKTPISAKDYARAADMAETVQRHPWAGQLFTDGEPEASLFWTDAETGVQCRARFDWLRTVREGRRLIVPDYKTARSADPQKFARSAADYGYHQQAAFYLDGATALGLDPDPAFVFVVQEKAQPYLVTVVELDEEALKLGRDLNRRALRLYAECLESDTWPGFADGLVTVSLPTYYLFAAEELLSA